MKISYWNTSILVGPFSFSKRFPNKRKTLHTARRRKISNKVIFFNDYAIHIQIFLLHERYQVLNWCPLILPRRTCRVMRSSIDMLRREDIEE